MLEKATIDTTDETKEALTAILIAIIDFAQRIGFFANHPGAVGYQVCPAFASKLGEMLSQTFDPGSTNTTDRFYTLIYEAADILDGFSRLFVRADAQFGAGHIPHLLGQETPL